MVNNFEYLDIVEFKDIFTGNIKRGYINKDLKIRCPNPVYETHEINDSTIMVKKQGWK